MRRDVRAVGPVVSTENMKGPALRFFLLASARAALSRSQGIDTVMFSDSNDAKRNGTFRADTIPRAKEPSIRSRGYPQASASVQKTDSTRLPVLFERQPSNSFSFS